MIKCLSDLRQVGGFLRVLRFPLLISKTDRHDIAEILLKVELNIITPILNDILPKRFFEWIYNTQVKLHSLLANILIVMVFVTVLHSLLFYLQFL